METNVCLDVALGLWFTDSYLLAHHPAPFLHILLSPMTRRQAPQILQLHLSCSLLTPTHMHTTTGVVWLFLVRAGGVVEVSLASCALTIEHHLVPTLHQVSMQTPSVL